MSTKLVKRLRDYAHNLGGKPEDYLTWQAADRIEALEAVLREIADLRYSNTSAAMLARAALLPEQDK